MAGTGDLKRWTGFGISLSWRVWNRHRDDLADLVSRYPKIFGHMRRGPFWSGFVNHYLEPVIPEDFDAMPEDMKPGEKRDEWGTLWGVSEGGVGRHPIDSEAPLADWKALDTYQPPDPAEYRDRHGRNWDEIEEHFRRLREKGHRIQGDGGQLFTRLYYLRGFNNLMIDIATDDPRLPRMLDMVKAYEDELVRRWMSIGVDSMYFHTDIGMQDRLMISPKKFRQWIKPWFKEIFLPVKNAGIPIDLSTDGHLLEIVDDLVECGVTSLQAQVRANTLEGIEKYYRGKLHIGLDLDRQMFAFCSPSEIKDQVREAVERLWSPEGGLGLHADVIDPNTPLKNIEALCEAGYEYCLANKPDAA